MQPLITVIIPVYNIERYIEKCIRSVIGQTYKNLEIILVDDGSNDNSGLICDKYAKEDSRIKVIHKKNGGLSDARNIAIDIAKGKYLTFIDGDDYVSFFYIETLYSLINEGYDISICGFKEVFEGGIDIDVNKRKKHKLLRMDASEALKTMLYQKNFDTSACGKLYKSELFAKGIRYPVGKLFEDLGTTYKLFLDSKKIIYCDTEMYFYLQRGGSISNDKYNIRKNDYLHFAEDIYDVVKLNAPECTNAAASRVISVSAHLMRQMYSFENNDEGRRLRKNMYTNIQKYRKGLIFDANIRNKNRIVIMMSYLPFCIFDFIFKFFQK